MRKLIKQGLFSATASLREAINKNAEVHSLAIPGVITVFMELKHRSQGIMRQVGGVDYIFRQCISYH